MPNVSRTIPFTPALTSEPKINSAYLSIPGKTLTRTTLELKSGRQRNRTPGGGSWSALVSNVTSLTPPSPSGGYLYDLKPLIPQAFTLVVRLALKMRLSKTMTHSGIELPACPATKTLSMRLFRPSERTTQRGICDPVKTMGFLRPSSAKDTADAVYAIVSVPVTTTIPS